jgi:hypothetical protein
MGAAGPMGPRDGDGAPPIPPTSKRGRRLRSIANVRAGLASVWRQIETGTLDLARARVLVYCGSVLLAAMEKGELEERIAALEATEAGRARE